MYRNESIMVNLRFMWLSERQFAELAAAAMEELPPGIAGWLENVTVVVESWPDERQLELVGVSPGATLLGLYEGVPRTSRTSDYGMVLPDKITLFRGPILALCSTESCVKRQVSHTITHELAHHFGIDDDRLIELGAY